MNEHQTGYRVSWYDENSIHQQKYFFGQDAHGDAKLFKKYMDEKYPSRRSENILRRSNRNKSGMVGVFRDDNSYICKGKPYSYPYWGASIRVNPDGKKCRKTFRFYDHKEGSSEAAVEKACECRGLYNQCIENGNISTFYKIYN